ncbi:MAG: hypothetical protein RIR70_625, partial [Pseudomonadota bacterium]
MIGQSAPIRPLMKIARLDSSPQGNPPRSPLVRGEARVGFIVG